MHISVNLLVIYHILELLDLNVNRVHFFVVTFYLLTKYNVC